MDNYNVLKQIGKGSFSNVHLCRRKRNNSSLLILSGLYYDEEEDDDDLFIVKEVNLENLVRKYLKKSLLETKQIIKYNKHISGTTSVSITPYNNKVLLQQLNSEEEYYYKRLKDLIDSEIEVLNRLSHDNVIKYFSYDIKNQIYYIKMEYCQYGDLYSILKDCKINDFKLRNTFNGFEGSFIRKFLKDTVNSLEYLHSLNIIHRDIKLHNFLVKKDKINKFIFKLSDFGFACFDLDCELNDSLSLSDFDFSTSALKRKYYKLCGTPYYMAPEIILNIEEFEQLTSNKKNINNVKFYDKKVDLWSYGICLYELIFNMLPFSDIYDINGLKTFFSKATTQLDLHKNIDNKTIDNRIKVLLKKLLTINPSFRISTKELVEYVKQFDLQQIDDLVISDSIIDIINCNENVYQTNEIMKENVMKEPINMDNRKSIVVEVNNDSHQKNESFSGNGFVNSWDKINKASSLIMKISVDNNFMKWLLNKK
jgi:serine/threonine protein kinase